MNNADKIFHQSAGTHLTPSNLVPTKNMMVKTEMVKKTPKAPTPFQMIGDAVKGGVKAVGRVVLNKLVDPSINVSKEKDKKDQVMSLKAKRGDFNRGY